ncbi:MAG: twin-arginine translocase subunit TatC [Alistipes sp.]|nr:twin-arginine translocase subunit TatC [Alistipes sp.]
MSNQTTHDEAEMTFGEHLDELRKILVRVVLVFMLLFIVLFAMKGIVLDIVFAPIRETFPTNRFFNWLATLMNSEVLRIRPDNVELFNNKMAGQFMLHIKSSFVGAFIVAFPYLIWELWLFVKPALPPRQRRQSIRYAIETPIWFIMGLLFGYYIIAPLAINFLGNYQVSDQISNIIDVSSFMTTVISVSFAAAVAFQLPLLIRLLATMGIVSSEGMRQYRKIAVAALLIFAAIITPPDVVSQVLIFIPCYALYEYGIRIAERIEARRAKEEAAYQARLAAERAEAEKSAAEQGSDEEKQGGNNNNDNSLTDDSESQDEAGTEESVDNVDEPKPAAHSYDSDMASPDELPTEVEGRKVEYEIIAVECDDATGEPIQKD